MYTSKNVDIDILKQKVDVMLKSVLGRDDIVEKWWNSQNWHFNLETPSIVWEYDHMAVYNYVSNHLHH